MDLKLPWIFLPAEFKVTIFPGLAGMLEFCRQNKNCNDVAEDHELSQNHMLGGFGKPWCFPMTTSISSSAKTHHEEWICLWEMHKPLAVTYSSMQKKVASCFLTLLLQVAGQQVHQSGSAGLNNAAWHRLQFGLMSKGPVVGVLTCTRSWVPWLCQ